MFLFTLFLFLCYRISKKNYLFVDSKDFYQEILYKKLRF